MSMGFSFFVCRSCLLSADEVEAMRATAEVLEQDAHGLKVLRLQNGDILKLFRVKRTISSARFYSYARRFYRNATRLRKLDTPTVIPKRLYRFQNSSDSAVLYEPLPGDTVRQLARAGALTTRQLAALGTFIASLHDLGIYFRSLHLGNIILTPDGKFGLIDVADMSIISWKLSCSRRIRNFRHLQRLQDDMRMLGEQGWRTLLESYLNHSDLSIRCASILESTTLECFSRIKTNSK